MSKLRNLIVVLGDQLSDQSPALDGFHPKQDAIWMAEVRDESRHVWSHKARSTYFLSAMRHFRDQQKSLGRKVLYTQLDDVSNAGSLSAELEKSIKSRTPGAIRLTEPGDFRVKKSLEETARGHRIPLQLVPDNHFISSNQEFEEHCRDRKQLRLEFFYRELRKKTGILMEGSEPLGGAGTSIRRTAKASGKRPGIVASAGRL